MPRPKLACGACLHCGTLLDRPTKRREASGAGSWANVSKRVRQYLFKGDRGCVICAWAERNPITGKVPLHVDHIDGDWRNNRPDNLRLLMKTAGSDTGVAA